MHEAVIRFWGLTLIALSGIALAHDGAVSGGGGGTTNPHPADPEWVSSSIVLYSGPVIVGWLNRQERDFDRLTEAEKQKSPLLKLFRSPKSIFDIVKQTQVELRMSKPCYDADGSASDGSIYATRPGAVCLSPFTMAPKLNENNVHQETLALLIHELTHLVGTSEQEAVTIQQHALWDLNRSDLLDTVTSARMLADSSPTGDVASALMYLGWLIEMPATIKSSALLSRQDDLARLREKLDSIHRTVLYVSAHRMALFSPELVRLKAVRDFVTANDPREDADTRAFHAALLQKGFRSDTRVTARQYLSRVTNIEPELFEPAYDEVTIQQLKSVQDVIRELTRLKAYLTEVKREVTDLSKADFPGYRLP